MSVSLFRVLGHTEANSHLLRGRERLPGPFADDPHRYPFTSRTFLDAFEGRPESGRVYAPILLGVEPGRVEVDGLRQVEWDQATHPDVARSIYLATIDAGLVCDEARRPGQGAPPFPLPHMLDWTLVSYLRGRVPINLLGEVIYGYPGQAEFQHESGRFFHIAAHHPGMHESVDVGWRGEAGKCQMTVGFLGGAVRTMGYEFTFREAGLASLRTAMGVSDANLFNLASWMKAKVKSSEQYTEKERQAEKTAGYRLVEDRVLDEAGGAISVTIQPSPFHSRGAWPLVESLRTLLWTPIAGEPISPPLGEFPPEF